MSSSDRPGPTSTAVEEEKAKKEKEIEEEEFDPLTHMIHNVVRELNFNEEADEEEDVEDVPIVQRKRRRTQESSKKVEAAVPAKRPRRVAWKYTTPTKEGSSVRIAFTTTKRRKVAVKVVDVDSRSCIDHLVIDMGFLRDHALEKGW